MNIQVLTQLPAILTATILLVASSVMPQFSEGRTEDPRQPFGGGDVAFTEPVESIKVACGETGIVGDVRVARGARVQRDELLLELDMSVLEAARQLAAAKARSTARLNAAQVEFEQRNQRYEKLEQLLRENAGSPEEVERAKADMQVAHENVVARKGRERTEPARTEGNRGADRTAAACGVRSRVTSWMSVENKVNLSRTMILTWLRSYDWTNCASYSIFPRERLQLFVVVTRLMFF